MFLEAITGWGYYSIYQEGNTTIFVVIHENQHGIRAKFANVRKSKNISTMAKGQIMWKNVQIKIREDHHHLRKNTNP